MTLPDANLLYDVTAVTWPAAETRQAGPVTLRRGDGGGSRVSAATVAPGYTDADIADAQAAMRAMQQPALFMIRAQDAALDQMLANQGYLVKDPVSLYVAPIAQIATQRPPPVTSFEVWPPLQAQRDIWAEGGIGASRLAVMQRAPSPKTTILGRLNDRPAGTLYVGMHAGCAMIHALEIATHSRRQGLAAMLTIAAAFWALNNGAQFLTLVTTQANTGANALYTSLGMQVVGHYHYRIEPDPNH